MHLLRLGPSSVTFVSTICICLYVPLGMESYGRLGREASRFFSDLGDVAASDGRLCKATFVQSVRQELRCAPVKFFSKLN